MAVAAASPPKAAGIAAELNRAGIPIASERGEWQPVQVRRLLARLA
jgi:hypothetical protein